MNNRQQKTALITGATSGIGAAYARRLARDGYNLILTGRREEKIKALAEELSRVHSVNVEALLIELSDRDQVELLVNQIKRKPIDLLVNNAGFGTTHFFHEEPLETQQNMISVHILSVMKLTHTVLPGMIEKRQGVIINVSSAGAFLPTPAEATYTGTKAFLVSFTESLHLELLDTGVKVQVVCPGLTLTDMPLRKLGITEEQLLKMMPYRWMKSGEVVEESMNALKKNQVVCVPGMLTRLTIFSRFILPAAVYYKTARSFYKNHQQIEDI